jgi:hypothetical protein
MLGRFEIGVVILSQARRETRGSMAQAPRLESAPGRKETGMTRLLHTPSGWVLKR